MAENEKLNFHLTESQIKYYKEAYNYFDKGKIYKFSGIEKFQIFN